MIEVGNIVTLENNKEFLILEELNEGTRRFVYTVKVLPDETPTGEYVIFEAIYIDNGEYLKDITDKAEYDRVAEEFKKIISDKFMSGDYNEMIAQMKEGEE